MQNRKEAHLYICLFVKKNKVLWLHLWMRISQVCLPCISQSDLEYGFTNRSGEDRQRIIIGPLTPIYGWVSRICLWPVHICENRRKEEKQRKDLFNPGYLNTTRYYVPTSNNSLNVIADLSANENIKPERMAFLVLQTTHILIKKINYHLFFKNVLCAYNQNTHLNNIMWWKMKGTKDVLVTGSCCVKQMQHEVYIFMWV